MEAFGKSMISSMICGLVLRRGSEGISLGNWLQDDHPAQRICRLSRELQAPVKACRSRFLKFPEVGYARS